MLSSKFKLRFLLDSTAREVWATFLENTWSLHRPPDSTARQTLGSARHAFGSNPRRWHGVCATSSRELKPNNLQINYHRPELNWDWLVKWPGHTLVLHSLDEGNPRTHHWTWELNPGLELDLQALGPQFVGNCSVRDLIVSPSTFMFWRSTC